MRKGFSDNHKYMFGDTFRQVVPLKTGVLAALAVVVITSIPQINVWIVRGNAWQGFYAIIDYDELAYSNYMHSLMQGRPRKNNPYQAVNNGDAKESESLYSIQFIPPYLLAGIGRALRFSTASVFILLLPVMAFIASMAVFWILTNLTSDRRLAAVGLLMVLLCGRLVSENPLTPEQSYSSFAFLRRYTPAVPFPVFFAFCVCACRALTVQLRPLHTWLWLSAGVVAFWILVYSYFYLWTTALAWFISFGLLWQIARWRQNDRHALKFYVFLALLVIALLPYFLMLSNRADTIEANQALVFTHRPDLLRVSEMIAVIILLFVLRGIRKHSIDWRSPSVIYVVSCAATTFLVFNQQVISGRLLQAFHYEQFIVNYLIIVALVVTYHLFGPQLRIRPALWVIFALAVGTVTGAKEARDNIELNARLDQAVPVFERLEQFGSGQQGRFALFNNSLWAAAAPTSTSVPELWSPSMYTYDMRPDDQTERFYLYLYYLGVDPEALRKDLESSPQMRAALFGLHRANSAIISDFSPVTTAEIDEKVRSYALYASSFSQQEADRWPLGFVIMIDEKPYDLSNLDRWYWRAGVERIDGSIIYLLRKRHELKEPSTQ